MYMQFLNNRVQFCIKLYKMENAIGNMVSLLSIIRVKSKRTLLILQFF